MLCVNRHRFDSGWGLRSFRTFAGFGAVAIVLASFLYLVLHSDFALGIVSVLAMAMAVGLGFLTHDFLLARQRVEVLDRQAAQLRSTSQRLEQSLASAAA